MGSVNAFEKNKTKKSEPFAYRLWVRISTVWCGKRELNPYGENHTPLKRARLPVPPLPQEHFILYFFFLFCQELFGKNILFDEVYKKVLKFV